MGVTQADGLRTIHRVKVHVWELPVRFMHWAIVGSIGVLAVSGIVIANGNMGLLIEHPTGMNVNRAIHTGAGYILVLTVIARIIWMFIGGRYTRWGNFLPVSKERRTGFVDTLKYYTFLKREPISEAGHNPMAGLAYTGVYFLLVLQSITGIVMVGMDRQGGFLWNISHWILAYVDSPIIRFAHHGIMWVLGIFLIQHLYSMVLVDIEENSGIVSSMVTGVKMLTVEAEHEAEEVEEEAFDHTHRTT
jgi:Ni/Fe-hydrogenase 1 B-type cytochrome subunit